MKITFLSILLWSLVVLSGCSYDPIPHDNSNVLTWDDTNIILTGDEVQAPLVDTLSGDNGEYTLFFDDTSMTKTFTLHHDVQQQNMVYFINDGYTKLNVDIVLPDTNPTPNLRLTTITMPDGSTDGPFGLQTDYDLTQNGGYQLRISESLMAWEPWTGDVQVTVSVSR